MFSGVSHPHGDALTQDGFGDGGGEVLDNLEWEFKVSEVSEEVQIQSGVCHCGVDVSSPRYLQVSTRFTSCFQLKYEHLDFADVPDKVVFQAPVP